MTTPPTRRTLHRLLASRQHLRLGAFIVLFVAGAGSAILARRWLSATRQEPHGFEYERLPARPAPNLLLVAPDGTRQNLDALRGQAILIHFWATWCPPCRAELPALLELGAELAQSGGPRLLALSVDHDWDSVRGFFHGDVPPQVRLDAAGTANATYELDMLPETFLIAADGSLRLRFTGAQDWTGERVRETLRAEAPGAL